MDIHLTTVTEGDTPKLDSPICLALSTPCAIPPYEQVYIKKGKRLRRSYRALIMPDIETDHFQLVGCILVSKISKTIHNWTGLPDFRVQMIWNDKRQLIKMLFHFNNSLLSGLESLALDNPEQSKKLLSLRTPRGYEGKLYPGSQGYLFCVKI